MLRLILFIALATMTTFSFAQDDATVSDVVGMMSDIDFDLNDYPVDGQKNTEDSYYYELVSVDYDDNNFGSDYDVVVTIKRRFDIGVDNYRVDTKLLSRADWSSRIYARDAQTIAVGSARYRLNENLSVGPAVIREKNYSGNIPRGSNNPNTEYYFGGSIKFVIQ